MSDCLEQIKRNNIDFITINPDYPGPVSLAIGGISIQLINRSPIPLAFDIAYKDFLELKTGDTQIETFDGKPSLPNDLQPRVNVPTFWSISTNKASQVFHLFYNESDTIHQTLVVDSSYTSGKAYDYCLLEDRSLISPIGYPMDFLLFSKLLAVHSGFILHGCAVVLDEKAYIFTGRKGAGKSTTGRLWLKRGAKILSEEQIVLRLHDGKAWVYGSPWYGETRHCANERYPIEAIFCIEHGETNKITPILPVETVPAIFSKLFVATAFKEDVPHLLSTCQQITLQVPTYRYHFVPEESAVDFVLNYSR